MYDTSKFSMQTYKKANQLGEVLWYARTTEQSSVFCQPCLTYRSRLLSKLSTKLLQSTLDHVLTYLNALFVGLWPTNSEGLQNQTTEITIKPYYTKNTISIQNNESYTLVWYFYGPRGTTVQHKKLFYHPHRFYDLVSAPTWGPIKYKLTQELATRVSYDIFERIVTNTKLKAMPSICKISCLKTLQEDTSA